MTEKACFGILDKVFPMGTEGLREVPGECFGCEDRLQCLKTAINTEDGFKMRSNNLERIPAGGLLGRIRRWSQKKELSRQASENRKK